jgi:hypothetical protein
MIIPPVSSINIKSEDEIIFYESLKGGWLEEVDGAIVLHVNGSHYDIGYQHGYLLKDKIYENYHMVFDDVTEEVKEYIREFWNIYEEPFTPNEYLEEIQGLVDGSGMTYDEIILFFTGWRYIMFGNSCIEMAAWGPATSDGKLYSLYSCDLPEVAYNETTGKYLHDNQILMVREPEDGYATLSVILPGEIMGIGGINEKGLSIAIESSPSYDVNYQCVSPIYRCRMLLEQASNSAEAIEILKSDSTGGINYILSDGNAPAAFVIEETSNYFYIGHFDHPVENTKPFWSINHVVRRKNMYIHPLTAMTQRNLYNPKLYLLLGLLPRNNYWFNPWRYYKTISNEIEKLWGNLNLTNTMDMLRNIYQGKTDIFLAFLNKIGKEKFASYYQWVACPETGDFAVSFAHGEKRAQYNKIHYVNLFDLLDNQPP